MTPSGAPSPAWTWLMPAWRLGAPAMTMAIGRSTCPESGEPTLQPTVITPAPPVRDESRSEVTTFRKCVQPNMAKYSYSCP